MVLIVMAVMVIFVVMVMMEMAMSMLPSSMVMFFAYCGLAWFAGGRPKFRGGASSKISGGCRPQFRGWVVQNFGMDRPKFFGWFQGRASKKKSPPQQHPCQNSAQPRPHLMAKNVAGNSSKKYIANPCVKISAEILAQVLSLFLSLPFSPLSPSLAFVILLRTRRPPRLQRLDLSQSLPENCGGCSCEGSHLCRQHVPVHLVICEHI